MSSILGFDTSTGELTVAITTGADVVAEREAGPDVSGRPRHARELMRAIDGAVVDAGGWDRISCLAVGVGPGTFTGLRIGVSTARALAQARGLPLAGVSSLRALATGAHSLAPAATLAVLDAKRGEAFAALHEGDVELWPPWVGPPGALAERVSALDGAPLAVGDGSIRFRDELEAAGAVVPADEDPVHRLRARHVCHLVARAEAGRPELIQPTYLRRPDAELWRERDRGSRNGP